MRAGDDRRREKDDRRRVEEGRRCSKRREG